MTVKNRVILASLVFLLSLMTMMPTPIAIAPTTTLTLSDDELYTQFAYEWGPGTLTGKTVANFGAPGVRFDFTGLSPSSGTGVGDNFPVDQLAGGAYKTYGTTQQFSTWGDFSAYTSYCLVFENVGQNAVNVNLKMNTGWTIPPPEYATLARDTYWQNTWTYVGAGQTVTVILDFSSATVWNAMDDPDLAWRIADGTAGVTVRRTDEVSDVGFQVLGDGAGSILVSQCLPPPVGVPEFTLITPAIAAVSMILFVATRRYLGKGSLNLITHP